MLFFVAHKTRDRGLFSILRSFIKRRRRDDEEDHEQPIETNKDPSKYQRNNDTHAAWRDTFYSNDTNSIVNQLAALAASIRGISSNDAASIHSSSSTTSTYIQAEERIDKPQDLEGDESFEYLRSLITVSCGPQPAPDTTSTSSTETPTLKVPPLRRKRASSRLSLRFDIPGLSFTPKTLRKPCPRYTTLPPIYTPNPIPIRPQIRF
ncbi:uncharacterized protein N7483_003474 [Penicillium malachiteum]|uniref:uncharacterized protein n=1 Tax=Penicillium malachiteum TaxID=1324776 RepID=UPI002547C064|nr:uncharacterized protein N7483_003474 [Penicillium malachiteum]KAJ5728966.1 hypothetical protein N7483_003474 [Penicillium malachiteum]